jgi:hypothetical protein
MTDETTIEEKAAAPQKVRVPAVRPTLAAGARVAAIVPRTFEDAQRIARAAFVAGWAPSSFLKGVKEDEAVAKITLAILTGSEVGMPPMSALQSIAIINGRPTIWGDAIPALLWSNDFDLTETLEGEGDGMIAVCTVIRPNGKEITRKFSVAMAKTAGLWNKKGKFGEDTPWVTYPTRMLQMRARGWAARDGASDVLRGLQMREEVEDYADSSVLPEASGIAELLEAPREGGFKATAVEDALVETITVTDENGAAIDEQNGGEENITDATFDPEEEKAAEPEFDIVEWCGSYNLVVANWTGNKAALESTWKQAVAEGRTKELKDKHPELFRGLKEAVFNKAKELTE